MKIDNAVLEKFATILLRMSVTKTAYFSLRSRGIVIVGRRSRVRIGKGAKIVIRKRGYLLVGIEFYAPYGASLIIKQNGTLDIRGRVNVMRGTVALVEPNANLTVGDKSLINENSKIICKSRISIGSNCGIGWNNNIIDSDMHYVIHKGKKKVREAPISIGDHVWTGFNVSILKGVTVADNCIIGAGSLVTKDISEHTLAVGNPAHEIAEDVDWLA